MFGGHSFPWILPRLIGNNNSTYVLRASFYIKCCTYIGFIWSSYPLSEVRLCPFYRCVWGGTEKLSLLPKATQWRSWDLSPAVWLQSACSSLLHHLVFSSRFKGEEIEEQRGGGEPELRLEALPLPSPPASQKYTIVICNTGMPKLKTLSKCIHFFSSLVSSKHTRW